MSKQLLPSINFLSWLLFAVMQTGPMLQAADFGIAAAGQAEAVIAVGADSTAPEKKAAAMLARYLGKVTGAEFTVVGEDAVKAGTRAIYVGQTRFAAAQGIDFGKLDREEWVIRSVDAGGADAVVIRPPHTLSPLHV